MIFSLLVALAVHTAPTFIEKCPSYLLDVPSDFLEGVSSPSLAGLNSAGQIIERFQPSEGPVVVLENLSAELMAMNNTSKAICLPLRYKSNKDENTYIAQVYDIRHHSGLAPDQGGVGDNELIRVSPSEFAHVEPGEKMSVSVRLDEFFFGADGHHKIQLRLYAPFCSALIRGAVFVRNTFGTLVEGGPWKSPKKDPPLSIKDKAKKGSVVSEYTTAGVLFAGDFVVDIPQSAVSPEVARKFKCAAKALEAAKNR